MTNDNFYAFTYEERTAKVPSDKMIVKDDPLHEEYSIYVFQLLTTIEKDEIEREFYELEIPFDIFPENGLWTIQVKEFELDKVEQISTEYEFCPQHYLIELISQRSKRIEELESELTNLRQAYSKLYHENSLLKMNS